jgi:hypothetical protein
MKRHVFLTHFGRSLKKSMKRHVLHIDFSTIIKISFNKLN